MASVPSTFVPVRMSWRPGAMVPPILTYFAITWNLGFAIPMAIGTIGGLISLLLALSISPETRGKELVADVVLA